MKKITFLLASIALLTPIAKAQAIPDQNLRTNDDIQEVIPCKDQESCKMEAAIIEAANIQLLQGNKNSAIKIYKEHINSSQSKPSAEVIFQTSHLLVDQEKYEDAEKLLADIPQAEHYAKVVNLYARALEKQEKYKELRLYLEKVDRVRPLKTEAILTLIRTTDALNECKWLAPHINKFLLENLNEPTENSRIRLYRATPNCAQTTTETIDAKLEQDIKTQPQTIQQIIVHKRERKYEK